MEGVNAKTACQITGLTYRQLDYWDRTHTHQTIAARSSGYWFSTTLQLYGPRATAPWRTYCVRRALVYKSFREMSHVSEKARA